MKLSFSAICILALAITAIGQPSIQQWHPTDLSFTSSASYANPFQNVTMSATFTGPGATTLTVPGFHNGGTTWIVRFSPTKIGSWSYTTASSDANLNGRTGTITCVANANANVHGKLWIDQDNPYHFKYEDGTHYFLMGGEIDWLGLMDFSDGTIAKEKQIIDMYDNNGFNHIMMDIYASQPTWGEPNLPAYDFGPPDMDPWGTDRGRMDPAFFNHYDKVIDYLFQKGMVAHLYFKVYTKQVSYPSNYSSDDSLFWRYITSRYQAYPNILWDFAKESQTMPNSNNQYKKDMINYVKSLDAYRRIITTHDDDGFFADASCIATVDIRTDQHHSDWYTKIISQRAAKSWPVYNSEYGYEIGPGGPNDCTYCPGTSTQRKSPIDMAKVTYEIVMAGGYPAYYYTYHAWDIVRYDETPAGLAYYRYLTNFFARANWYELSPSDNLIGASGPSGLSFGNHCLANPGSEYIVYLHNGGSVNLTVAGAGAQLTATWMDALTGAEQSGTAASNGTYTATSPWSNTPSLLWLRMSGPYTPAATSVVVSPSTALVAPSATLQFSAAVLDQRGAAFAASVGWTATIGSINASGQFSAPSTTGSGYVIATIAGTSIRDSSAVTVGSGQSGTFYVEASSGALANGMSASTGSGSMSAQVISGTTGNITTPLSTDSKATYTITVAAGTWYAWARLYGTDDTHNSFWIQIDNAPAQRLGNAQTFNAWTWERNQGAAIDLGALSAGSHTLTIFSREPGALIDKICLTPDAGFVPADNTVRAVRSSLLRFAPSAIRAPSALYNLTGKRVACGSTVSTIHSKLPRGVYVEVTAGKAPVRR